MNERADREDDWPVSDPPVAGVPGLGPVPAYTDSPAPSDTTHPLLEFRCTGGRARRDEHLVVGGDGRATLRRPDSTRELELGRGTMEQLRRELDAARFAELPEDLRRPPTAAEPQPDVVEYAITADGHTVRALGSALPAELLPLVEALNVVMSGDAAR